jgi:arsenate reductase-like glutaredoxin family protein
MEEIQTKAKAHADARARLAEIVTTMQDGIEAIKRKNMPRLKGAVNKAVETSEELRALIEQNPDLFTRPKSVVFHGIKLGYQKAKGKIEFDDPEKVIKLIRKHYPELADPLISTTEKPSKDALNNLAAEQLKKIGVTVTSDTDVVFIRPTDGEVDELVNALLKGVEEEVEA